MHRLGGASEGATRFQVNPEGDNMTTSATTWSERTALAQESGRVSLICKYLPVTNHRGTRITVQRNDSPTYGKDPHKITVSWNYALGISGNYEEAVQTYLDGAKWRGIWKVATTHNGAVAVFVSEIHG